MREVIGILGKTGFGKSVWTRRYIKNQTRLFMFDPLQDADLNYVDLKTLLEMHDEGLFLDGTVNQAARKFKVGIFNPGDLPAMGAISFVSGNNCLVIEECAIAFENPRHSLDSWLNELIFLGRHRRVTMIFIAQRAVSIPIAVRSQFTRLVSFAQHEGTDMEWLRSYFGRRVWDIPDLQPLECLDCYQGSVDKYLINYDYPRRKKIEIGTEIESNPNNFSLFPETD